MGTTLTGTTPQDTYDSLIKVTDNGPLSGTAKYLSDGLGNDSVLALSTSKVGIATNTPAVELHVETSATGTTALSNVITTLRSKAAGRDINIQFSDGTNQSYIGSLSGALYLATGGANEQMRITSAGNVGIGTIYPAHKLDVSGVIGGYQGGQTAYKTYTKAAGFQISAYQSVNGSPYTKTTDIVANADSGVSSELRVLVAASGSNPAEVARFTPNGLTFNGDTAAANALDDYEEGTWTPTLGSDGTGAFTIDTANGKYTKIGNMVRITGYIAWSANTCTGNGILAGLPFGINFTPNPQAQGILIHEGTVSQGLHFRHDGATTTSQGYSYSFGGSIQNVSVFGSSGNIAVNATYFV